MVLQEEEEVVCQPEAADRRSSQETVIVAAATAPQQPKLRDDEQLIEAPSSPIEAKVPKLKASFIHAKGNASVCTQCASPLNPEDIIIMG